jgi:hypothetical protein
MRTPAWSSRSWADSRGPSGAGCPARPGSAASAARIFSNPTSFRPGSVPASSTTPTPDQASGLIPKVGPVRRGAVFFGGDSDRRAPTLSSATRRRLRIHGTTTSTFALTEVRAAKEPTEPPPPLKRWSERLVHRARAPGQRFRVRAGVRNCRFSGLFIGTYSPLPYAVPCRRSQRTRSYPAASRPNVRVLICCIGQPCCRAVFRDSAGHHRHRVVASSKGL